MHTERNQPLKTDPDVKLVGEDPDDRKWIYLPVWWNKNTLWFFFHIVQALEMRDE